MRGNCDTIFLLGNIGQGVLDEIQKEYASNIDKKSFKELYQ